MARLEALVVFDWIGENCVQPCLSIVYTSHVIGLANDEMGRAAADLSVHLDDPATHGDASEFSAIWSSASPSPLRSC